MGKLWWAAPYVLALAALLGARWQQGRAPRPEDPTRYHVAITSAESFNHAWLTRISHYHYLKACCAKRDFPDSAMGGFTRLLDTDEPDGLMEEIPTFLCGPWPEDVRKDYGPGRRAHTLRVWLTSSAPRGGRWIPEQYVLLIEPDILIFTPPPLLATPTVPSTYDYKGTMRPWNLGPHFERYNLRNVSLDSLQPTSVSPGMFYKRQLEAISHEFHAQMVRMLGETNQSVTWGWRLEMYAYLIAASQQPEGPVQHNLTLTCSWPPYSDIVEPDGTPKYIMHYPTPFAYFANGTGAYMDDETASWRFAKHDFKKQLPPLPLPLPPGDSRSAYLLVSALNEAACNLPGFSTGLACEPWLAAGPPLVPAAPGGSRWSRWKAALASKAAAVKAAVVEPAPSPAPQPPQYWLSVAIPSVPRPGGAAYLEATLTSLLRQLPLDPSDALHGRVRVTVMNLRPGQHDAFDELRRQAEEDKEGWFGRAAAAYVDWLEGPEQPARDSMEKCLDPTAEEMELGYPGRAQRRQTLDLAALLHNVTGQAHYHLLLEDDFEVCPQALNLLQYLIRKLNACDPAWVGLRASYGMSGVVLKDADVRDFTHSLLTRYSLNTADLLWNVWATSIAPEVAAAAGAPRRRYYVYRQSLMRHVGGVSSFGPQAGAAAAAAAPSPGCFALMSQVDSLNREEQYDEEACSGISDLSPCPNATAAAAVAGCAGWEPETWLVPMDAGAASNATGSGSSGGADSEAAEE